MKTMELDFEQLVELWREDESSGEAIFIGPDGVARYMGCRCAEHDGAGNPDFPAIQEWCNEHRYWPNIWCVNERGNVELYTFEGEPLGGLV